MEMGKLQTLTERAKELECLYAADEVLQNRTMTLPDVMNKLTEIIPKGFSTPEASRIRISLWADVYETPGFDQAEVIYRSPVLFEGDAVGEVAAGYVPALLKTPCQLLGYERKLMDTITLRISQLALQKRQEMALLLNILRQVDPEMLVRIGEKMRVYLEHASGGQAEALFRDAASREEPSYGESNTPTAVPPGVNSEELAHKLIEGATTFLSRDKAFALLGELVQEQRMLSFVKTVDRNDSSLSDILDAVRKYTGAMLSQADSYNADSQIETWLLSELAHRFLSDDEQMVRLVVEHLQIPDFLPMIENIIGSERSLGNIGGKGSGLFIANQILRHASQEDPLLADIKMPRTWYIATDHMVDFLHFNNLEELNPYKYNSAFHLRMTYDNIVNKIKNAALPPQTMNMLRVVLDDLSDTPLIVRSSSLLEDKHWGAFSGKYKSLFLSNQGTRTERLAALADAVLEVYSSMYNPDSIQYRRERGLLHFTEQMGILIQEVVGQKVGPYFMPLFAGVAFSKNLFRWSPRIRQEDGLVRMVMGLGTRAVDRVNNDYPILFSPGQPQLTVNQTPEDTLHYSPKYIDLINVETGAFETVEASAFLREWGAEVEKLSQCVSVYQDHFIEKRNAFTLTPSQDNMVITFQQVIDSGDIPNKIKHILDTLSERMQCPVDIEFAYDGQQFYLLQCRPQGIGITNQPAPIPQNLPPRDVLFTANRFITDGLLQELKYIVYIDADAYSALSKREDLLAVGEVVGMLNDHLPRRKYILMGPGRWGSRGDIKLGVRVTYADISNTAALIEIAKEKHSYVPELSFGTHFFQDLVESDILYLPLYPDKPGNVFHESYFTRSHNLLGTILPKHAYLQDVIKVIDVPESSMGRLLSVHMNSDLGQAVAFFKSPSIQPQDKPDKPSVVFSDRKPESEQEHWQWRYYMAQQIADSMDMESLGVKGIYLFGSTNTGASGIGSDIDLLLHADADETQKQKLRLWLDGWSQALARINFLQTGYDSHRLLDVHIVTDQDIENGDSYAVKINSSIDPATLLRKRQ